MKYLVFRADGSKEILDRAAPLQLHELQDLVGGYIEHVRIVASEPMRARVALSGFRPD